MDEKFLLKELLPLCTSKFDFISVNKSNSFKWNYSFQILHSRSEKCFLLSCLIHNKFNQTMSQKSKMNRLLTLYFPTVIFFLYHRKKWKNAEIFFHIVISTSR